MADLVMSEAFTLANNKFKEATRALENFLTKSNPNDEDYKQLISDTKLIRQGADMLESAAKTQLHDEFLGGKKKKLNKKSQRGGAIPDTIHNITAFENTSALLAGTVNPYDSAMSFTAAEVAPEAPSAGLSMPFSSSYDLPSGYRSVTDPNTVAPPPAAHRGGGSKTKKQNKNQNQKGGSTEISPTDPMDGSYLSAEGSYKLISGGKNKSNKK